MSRYFNHPMEQQFHKWDLEDRAKRDRYWIVLKRIRETEYYKDYKGITDLTVRPTFQFYVNEKYGFTLELSDIDGGYTNRYTVTDPKKFLLFQIKHGL